MLRNIFKRTIGQVSIEIRFEVKLGLWQALKLRLAGTNARPIIDEMISVMRQKINEQSEEGKV